MRRPLIGQRDRPALGFAIRLALHEHADPARQTRDLAFLPGDDGRQILGQPGQMRDRLFQMQDPFALPVPVLVHASSIR